MCVDYCPFYLHGTLKDKILHEHSNSVIISSKCTFITETTRDSKAFATLLEFLTANEFYKYNLKVMEAVLWWHRNFRVISVLSIRQENYCIGLRAIAVGRSMRDFLLWLHLFCFLLLLLYHKHWLRSIKMLLIVWIRHLKLLWVFVMKQLEISCGSVKNRNPLPTFLEKGHP